MKSPKLMFPQVQALLAAGKPNAIADHWAISPRIACRELIQNSLDAYAAKAKKLRGGGEHCKVLFKTAELSSSEIPEFPKYREILKKAQYTWKNTPTLKKYLSTIDAYARQDKVEVLYVIDNGKGFDQSALKAVLREGTPEKVNGSSGSFGVGHLTTFGLSGLQYIFYLGKCEDGSMNAAGHAILASHENKNGESYSEHGFYCIASSPPTFCNKKNIPKFLLREAKNIKASGSIVAVLGFKGFGEKNNEYKEKKGELSELIREAVAENFAIAICTKNLEVKIQEVEIINQASLTTLRQRAKPDIEKSKQPIKQIVTMLRRVARSNTGRSKQSKDAQLTLDAIETHFSSDAEGNLPGDFQDCYIKMRKKALIHNISIWRNGMLITRKHAGLSKGIFDGKKPLNAVVYLSGEKSPRKAHDLVKNAETPKHDRIKEKRLSTKEEKKNLQKLLDEIRKWIFEHAEDSGGDSAYLENEMMIDAGSAWVIRNASPTSWEDDDTGDDGGVNEPDSEGEGNQNGEGEGNEKPGRGARGKRAVTTKNNVPVPMQGRQIGERNYRLLIVPDQDMDEAILEILIDNGQDVSCTGTMKNKDIMVVATTLFSDFKELKCNKRIDGKVLLKNVRKQKRFTLDLEFNKPFPKDISLDCRLGKLQKQVLTK